MKTIKRSLLFLSLFSCLIIAGCGGSKSTADLRASSLGQELIDLEKAYKIGAITEDEYEDAKDNLIDSYN